jgi:hypothetical protein
MPTVNALMVSSPTSMQTYCKPHPLSLRFQMCPELNGPKQKYSASWQTSKGSWW